jgi:DNA-binding NarL/FixJ family response regulator
MGDMTVVTLRAELEAERAENARLRVALTTTRALEAMLPPPVHVIDPDRDLTRREYETLVCLMAGASNRAIARKMYVAESTVKIHLANLFTKLHVHNRTAAAIAGIRLGLSPS